MSEVWHNPESNPSPGISVHPSEISDVFSNFLTASACFRKVNYMSTLQYSSSLCTFRYFFVIPVEMRHRHISDREIACLQCRAAAQEGDLAALVSPRAHMHM